MLTATAVLSADASGPKKPTPHDQWLTSYGIRGSVPCDAPRIGCTVWYSSHHAIAVASFGTIVGHIGVPPAIITGTGVSMYTWQGGLPGTPQGHTGVGHPSGLVLQGSGVLVGPHPPQWVGVIVAPHVAHGVDVLVGTLVNVGEGVTPPVHPVSLPEAVGGLFRYVPVLL